MGVKSEQSKCIAQRSTERIQHGELRLAKIVHEWERRRRSAHYTSPCYLFTIVMLLANVTVMGVDKKNRTLFLGGLACVFDRFMLVVMNRGGFVATSGLNSPFPIVRHNMLISVGLLCRNLLRGDIFSVLDSTMSFVNDEYRT
jgi:hypothetical protein